MSRKQLNINVGDTFNKLTVVSETRRVSVRKRRFLCQCVCGNFKEINLVHLTTGHIKSCGCSTHDWHKGHFGDKNPAWKGGRREISGGYIEIYLPQHPAARQNGYIKEHRLIMERKLGRLLVKSENIHHINGDKSDNRIENLELWNVSQPAGQRVEDKLKWAKEIIALYE